MVSSKPAETTEPSEASASAPSPDAFQAGNDQGFATGTTATAKAPLTPKDLLRFELFRSARYHEDRERHYARIHRWLMALVVLSGSTAFAAAAGQNLTVMISGFVTTVAGLTDLVFDLAGKARLHASMKRQAFGMLSELDCGADCVPLRGRLVASWGEEPPQNGTVNNLAHNYAVLALGRPRGQMFVIGRWRRVLRHWWPGDADLRTYDEAGLAPPGGAGIGNR